MKNPLILKRIFITELVWVVILLLSVPVQSAEIFEYLTPTPNSSPADLAFDQEGNLWFTEMHGNKIARLVPSKIEPGTNKGIIEFSLPQPNSKPNFILISQDGSIWFSEMGRNSIGRFEPKDKIFKEYPIPTPSSEPHQLVEDKDGIIWFTEFETNKIGRLDFKSGIIQEFPLKKGHPHGLVLKDNMVWYTQGGKFWRKQYANKVASLNPMTGHIREFKISPKDSVPHGITKGVNGEIWFSQFLAKKISKLDFKQGGSKSRVDFFLGKKGGTPHDLLVDSKRDIIWYLDNHGDQIGKIDLTKAAPGTSNGLEIFKIPTKGAHPNQIAMDKYGQLWFTEMGAYFRGRYQNKIGKLIP